MNMAVIKYTSYGQMQLAKDEALNEALRKKPNQKLYRITTKYGYTTEIMASSKKDARRLSRLSKIESIDAVG